MTVGMCWGKMHIYGTYTALSLDHKLHATDTSPQPSTQRVFVQEISSFPQMISLLHFDNSVKGNSPGHYDQHMVKHYWSYGSQQS